MRSSYLGARESSNKCHKNEQFKANGFLHSARAAVGPENRNAPRAGRRNARTQHARSLFPLYIFRFDYIGVIYN